MGVRASFGIPENILVRKLVIGNIKFSSDFHIISNFLFWVGGAIQNIVNKWVSLWPSLHNNHSSIACGKYTCTFQHLKIVGNARQTRNKMKIFLNIWFSFQRLMNFMFCMRLKNK